MPVYRFWFLKDISAKNHIEAVTKALRKKAEFHSLEELKEEGYQATPAIGFDTGEEGDQYYPVCSKVKSKKK
jgi:hypothetical protein